MFRKPPSRIEQLQNTLSGALDTIQDAVDNLPLERLRGARDSAARNAAQGWEAALHHAGDAIHSAADVIGDAAGVVSSRAEGALHNAHEAASAARHRLQGRAGEARDRGGDIAHDLAHEAAHRAHDAAHHAHEAAHRAAHHAHKAAHRAAERAHSEIDDKREAWLDAWAEGKKSARKTAHQKRGEAEAAFSAGSAAASALAAHALDRVQDRARHRGREIASHVAVHEKPSKTWLWIGAGLLGGAALALLLSPERGRRSRDLIKGKLQDARAGAEGLREAAVGKAHHLENRAAGFMHERNAAKTADDADDITIADRVRTAMGENPATANLERLNIDCVDGLVTVRGPMADEALQAQIVAIIRAVKGVRDVQSDLLLEDAPEDSATFVG